MRFRALIAAGAIAALLPVTGSGPGAAPVPAASKPAASKPAASEPAASGPRSWVVLTDRAESTAAVVAGLVRSGARITDRNDAIGLLSVTSADPGFADDIAALPGVQGVAEDVAIGETLAARPTAGRASGPPSGTPVPAAPARSALTPRTDPLDNRLWGMRMIRADLAHRKAIGTHRVRVAVIDTGIDASHPDLRANFDRTLSRNFTTDMPAIDGPCEYRGCKDPRGVDGSGHGTHVAGIIGARLNGFGISGVAPGVDLINLRAGQDSGFFFIQPVVNALTFAADHGVDVANMSFYVDPWLYTCRGGAPGDTAAQAAQQTTIIDAMNRALGYARSKGVTLVAAAGNEHDNLSAPRPDTTSPDYPIGSERTRVIDNSRCYDLPVEAPNVIGVSALGPSGRKADYSNWSTTLGSGEVDVAAPGGWRGDGAGTATYNRTSNLILSTYPRSILRSEGLVDAAGRVTAAGTAAGVLKRCPRRPPAGAARCGYYAWLAGTSMASPHVAGVAALAVARFGSMKANGFGLAPKTVRAKVYASARDHACPAGGTQAYPGRGPQWTATCVGTAARNGFYGWGIVNALAVLR